MDKPPVIARWRRVVYSLALLVLAGRVVTVHCDVPDLPPLGRGLQLQLPDVPVVGYVSRPPVGTTSHSVTTYMQAQFSLSPRVLVTQWAGSDEEAAMTVAGAPYRATAHKVVVAHFDSAEARAQWLARHPQYHVIAIQDGLYLLQH